MTTASLPRPDKQHAKTIIFFIFERLKSRAVFMRGQKSDFNSISRCVVPKPSISQLTRSVMSHCEGIIKYIEFTWDEI